MTFDVTYASDWVRRGKIEIKTLEELIMFMEFNRNDVIIYRPMGDNKNYEIKVYDAYL